MPILWLSLCKCNYQHILLQEAMYQSTENENIDITLDLRNFGVPWALHCWIRTLLTANNNGFGSVIDELLQDFSKEWTEDNSSYFTDECLPVLFNIFRNDFVHGSLNIFFLSMFKIFKFSIFGV